MKVEQHLISIENASSSRALLDQGWEPANAAFSADHLQRVVFQEGEQLFKLGLRAATEAADKIFKKERPVWLGLLSIVSGYERLSEVDRLVAFATPSVELPNGPNYPVRFRYEIDYKSGQVQYESKNALGRALGNLKRAVFRSALELLGTPDLIYQLYEGVTYALAPSRFPGWERLVRIGSLRAYWRSSDVWFVQQTDGEYEYIGAQEWILQLLMPEGCDLINRASHGKVVQVGGGGDSLLEVTSEYLLTEFPEPIQEFSTEVKSFVEQHEKTAVLVHGAPGTGKTRWVYSMLDDYFIPNGFMVIFIDHKSLAEFCVPDFAEKLVVVLNEADNVAEDRDRTKDGSTEAILRLIDSSEVASLRRADAASENVRKIVYLMTCNTDERLDPAFKRKGRLDLIKEFDHPPYVDGRTEDDEEYDADELD